MAIDKILEKKLAEDKFDIDEHNPHIIVDYEKCRKCKERFCLICPVKNYRFEMVDGEERMIFSFEGCLECGACRLVCPHGAVKWNYPKGGKGICYRYG